MSFPRPLDHALLERLLSVRDPSGKPVVGTAVIREPETRWEFRPASPWLAGNYRLIVDTRLEDLAGNRVGRPFEVDTFHPITKSVVTQVVEIPFVVAGKK